MCVCVCVCVCVCACAVCVFVRACVSVCVVCVSSPFKTVATTQPQGTALWGLIVLNCCTGLVKLAFAQWKTKEPVRVCECFFFARVYSCTMCFFVECGSHSFARVYPCTTCFFVQCGSLSFSCLPVYNVFLCSFFRSSFPICIVPFSTMHHKKLHRFLHSRLSQRTHLRCSMFRSTSW